MSGKLIKKVYNKIQKINHAVDTYTEISKTPAIPYRAFVNYADYLYNNGSVKQSEIILNSAIDFISPSSDAIVNLGIIRQTSGNLDEAIKYYKKAIKKEADNTRALCLLGNCLSVKKDTANAIKYYEKAIKIDSKCSDAYLYWGINLLKEKKYTEAKEKFEQATLYGTKDARGFFMLASVEIELGLYDEALEKLIFLIEITENNFGAYHNIAYIYFKKKDYKKAIKYAKKSISLYSQKIETYLLLGDIYLLTDELDKAIQIYKKAEINNLKSDFLYISWGTALQKQNKYNEATEKFHLALDYSTDTTKPDIYAYLSKCYINNDNLDKATEYLQQSIDINPDNQIAIEIQAELCIKNNDYNKALIYLNKISDNANIKPFVFLEMARCYRHLNDDTNTKKYYQNTIEYDNNNPETLIEFVQYLISTKDFQTANLKLIILERLIPNDINVLKQGFIINYNLAKGNICGYNGIKALKLANKIKKLYADSFCFEEEYNILNNALGK